MAQAMFNQIDFSILQSWSKMEAELDQETKDLAILLKTFTDENENQQDQNSSQDNNVDPTKKKRAAYNNTKVKARNLLTNVAYRRFKITDFNKTNFVVDILSFLVQNCNPTNLEIKLETEKERGMVKFMWDSCILHDFTTYLLKQENYDIISQTNLTYQNANKVVLDYVKTEEGRLARLKYKLTQKFNLIHYIYSILYAKMYNRINHYDIKRKNDFDFQFQLWRKEKQQLKFLGKEPTNYLNRKVEKEEQMPIQDSNITKKNQKRKMLEEKLEENTKAMKRMKRIKSDSK